MGAFSGLITLEGGKELTVIDATKEFPSADTTVIDMHVSPTGELTLVTDDSNVITCREVEPEDRHPRLEPEWLTARIKELVECDKEGASGTAERLPTGEELGIQPGQLWVRRPFIALVQIQGYPHMVEVSTTNDVWGGGINVSILLPQALNNLMFTIKPSLLMEAYELYLQPTSYL